MSDRIATFADFYPWYLGEHEKPACRWLHFVGTSGFVGVAAACLVAKPVVFGAALAVALGLGRAFFAIEGRRSALPVLVGMIVLVVAANPVLLAGIGFAYLNAWIGHFGIEKNRPATFTYPLWSLAADFVLWSEMLRGRRWGALAPAA